MSITFYFWRRLKKVLLHTYVVAGRRLLKNTVDSPEHSLNKILVSREFSERNDWAHAMSIIG